MGRRRQIRRPVAAAPRWALPLGLAVLCPGAALASTALPICQNISLILPRAGEDVARTFDVSYVLPVAARGGTVRMSWASPEDDAGPHVITMAPALEAAGEHFFEMPRLSVAAREADQVLSVASAGSASPQDLQRGVVYTVTMQAWLEDGCN
eukprot:SAG22_NODE_11574_length_478_cov_1.094987_1_plen_151_part_10